MNGEKKDRYNGDFEHFSRGDRDLLITMHEQIKNIRVDIKEIKDGTSLKLEDHEMRLREIEKFKDNWTGRNAVLATVVMFLVGLLGSLVSKNFL